MLEPPPHSGAFSKEALIEAAASILRHHDSSPSYALESLNLYPGQVTLLTCPACSARSRFALAIALQTSAVLEAKPKPRIWWFNRRWLPWEAMRALLKIEVSRIHKTSSGTPVDVMAQVIGHIEKLGFEYHNDFKTTYAISDKIRIENGKRPGQLVIVDGLENFKENESGSYMDEITEQLTQLRVLAKETNLPLLVTCDYLPTYEAQPLKTGLAFKMTRLGQA